MKLSSPKNCSRIPLGPKESVSAMLLVKGGEIRGRIVTPPITSFSHPGFARRVTAKAKIKPRTVPAAPTAFRLQI